MKRHAHGFTIVELSLSLSFLSVLLITLAFLIIHITAIYQKGLVIRSVNANGRELIDDFTRSLNAAPATTATLLCQTISFTTDDAAGRCKNDDAYKFYYTTTTAALNINGAEQASSVPIHGAVCTGHYSYIWNSGYVLNGTANDRQATITGLDAEDALNDFRLLKVRDDNHEVCASRIDSNYNSITDTNSYKLPTHAQQEDGNLVIYELLPRSEDNLALYDFHLFPPVQHKNTRHSFNSATFILATVSGGIDITVSGDFCTDAPDDFNTDFNYCAINRFNFSARSSGDLTDTEEDNETYQRIIFN